MFRVLMVLVLKVMFFYKIQFILFLNMFFKKEFPMKLILFTILLSAVTFSVYAKKDVTIIGYIPEYRVSLMDKMDLGSLTHVIAAFANPDSNGDMSCPIDLEAFSAKVRAAGSKPVISIGGGGSYSWGDDIGVYHHLYADSNRTMFIQKLADYCELYQCAGIDLDIEGDALAHSGYDAFASELADTLHARNLEVYGVYGVGGQWSAVNASDETLQKLDFIGTMSYGGVGQWNWDKPTNQATLDRFKSDIQYFVDRGVDPSKIHGGIPFYSVGFPAQKTTNLSPYYHTVQQLVSQSFYTDQNSFWADTMINSDEKPEFFSGWNTNKKKIDFADSLSGGIMIWELGQDNFSGSGPNMLDSMVAYINYDPVPVSKKVTIKSGTLFNLQGSSLNINFNNTSKYSINIYNLQGRVIKKYSNNEFHKNQKNISLNLDHLGSGIFIVNLKTEQFNRSRRINIR